MTVGTVLVERENPTYEVLSMSSMITNFVPKRAMILNRKCISDGNDVYEQLHVTWIRIIIKDEVILGYIIMSVYSWIACSPGE